MSLFLVELTVFKYWRKIVRHIACLLVVLVSAHAYSDNDKGLAFVDGCVSLVNIYETKYEKSELAAVFTSVADSFQAGYCRGVLEVIEDKCDKNWHEMARFIAAQKAVVEQYSSTKKLISAACGR